MCERGCEHGQKLSKGQDMDRDKNKSMDREMSRSGDRGRDTYIVVHEQEKEGGYSGEPFVGRERDIDEDKGVLFIVVFFL